MLSGPVATVAGDANHHQRNPQLTASAADLSRVSVVMAWMPTASGEMREIRHASLSPWDAWPSDGLVGPAHLTATPADEAPNAEIDDAFAVAPMDGDGFGLLFPHPQGELPSIAYEVGYLPDIPADAEATATDLPVGLSNQYAAAAMFLGPGTSGRPIGMQTKGSFAALGVGWAPRIGVMTGAASSFWKIGCSPVPLVGDGEPYQDRWLLTFASNGTAFDDSACFIVSEIGLPDRVQIAVVSPSDGELAFVGADAWPAGARVKQLMTAPRGDGAWIAWTAGDDPSIGLARADGDGRIALAPVELVHPGGAALAGSLGLADLGDRAALAWIEHHEGQDPPAEDTLRVSIREADGSEALSAALPLESRARARVSVVGAPASEQIVVAWSERSTGSEPDRVRLARFACLSP